MKKAIAGLVIIFFMLSLVFSKKSFSMSEELFMKKLNTISDTVVVTIGHRTNDSTGSINISNAMIQQLLIPQIGHLKSDSVAAQTRSLIIDKNKVYLRFNVVDSAGQLKWVAVQLEERAQGSIVFVPGIGRELHIVIVGSNCGNCNFFLDHGQLLFGNCSTSDECKHSMFKII